MATIINEDSGALSVSSWTSASHVTPPLTNQITLRYRVRSQRGNSASRWYRRQWRIRIDYKASGAPSWITGTPSAWNDHGDVLTYSSPNVVFNFPSDGTWDFRAVIDWQDKDGTLFGTISYDQSTELVSAGATTVYAVNDKRNANYEGPSWWGVTNTLTLPDSVLNTSWEIWKLAYNFQRYHDDYDFCTTQGSGNTKDQCTKQGGIYLGPYNPVLITHLLLGEYGRAPNNAYGWLTANWATVAPTYTGSSLTFQKVATLQARHLSPQASGWPWWPTNANYPYVYVRMGIRNFQCTIYRQNPVNNGNTQDNQALLDDYDNIAGAAVVVEPSVGHLVLTGYTAQVLSPIQPAVGHLVITGYEPSVSIAPVTGHLGITGYAPVLVTGGTAALTQQSVGPLIRSVQIDPSLNSLRLGMSQSAIQRSFAGGEIAPALYARTNQVKYQTGLRTCRNFVVQRHGGAANRAGTIFVCEAKSSTDNARLVKFIFSDDQTYVIELGDFYMRLIKNGVLQRVTVLGAYDGGTAYVYGEVVSYGGVNYIAKADSTGQQPDISPTYWYALEDDIFEIETPWDHEDVGGLNYVQKEDVIVVVDRGYPIYEIRRYGALSWQLVAFEFGPDISSPAAVVVTPGTGGGIARRYIVTAIAKETYEESYPGVQAVKTLTNLAIVSGTTWRGTVAATTGWAVGDTVLFGTVDGPDKFSNREFAIDAMTGTTFDVTNTETSGGAFVSGTVYLAYGKGAAAATTTTCTITWTAVDPANTLEYNIYKEVNGVFGYVGTARGTSFVDANITPDMTAVPPDRRILFSEPGDYPGAVGYYQQRLLFGNTDNDPQAIWASRSANPRNFTLSSPSQSDDAVTWRQRGQKTNEVRHMVDIGTLLVLSSVAQWEIQGGTDGVLRPGEINPLQRGSNGSAVISPAVVSDAVIMVQARGSIIRDLRYDFSTYRVSAVGRDLSVFAEHLFTGHTINRLDYAETPNSVVHAIRDDGVMLGLTYMPEHDVWGWHKHDTQGLFLDVCCVPEGIEDVAYVLVERVINGVTKKYIERFASRQFTDSRVDAVFVDCAISYDGTNATATTMEVTTATTWDITELLTIESSASYFSGLDIGNGITLLGEDGYMCKITITQHISSTEVKGYADIAVQAEFQATPSTSWAKAVKQVTGLGHLEGMSVAVLGDGVPEEAMVASATIELVECRAFIHVGLGYVSDLETLDIDTVDGETIRDKQKLVTSVSVLVQSSGPVYIGPDFDNLRRSDPTLIPEGSVVTGLLDVTIDSRWETSGRFAVRQSEPLPLTVLAAIPRGIVAMGEDN